MIVIKVFKYKVGERIFVNSKAKKGMPNYVGREGTISECVDNSLQYDYVVLFNPGNFGKFREDELTDDMQSINQDEESAHSDKDLHRTILDEIHDTYKRKNADYGNSFGDQYNEYGLLSALIRFDDKIRRLKQLNKNEAQVKDESIRDSTLDLANYAIMTVMELDKNKSE